MEVPEDAGSRPVFGKVPRWYHLDCFMEKREELQASNLSANSLEGYSSLKKADKDVLDKQLGTAKVTKRSKGQTGAPPAKRTKEEQNELDYLKVLSKYGFDPWSLCMATLDLLILNTLFRLRMRKSGG